MERNYDNMLSPDFDDPLQYFDSSLTTSRATPTIYADDPWSVTEDAITFESNSTYPMGGDLSESSYFLQNTQEEIGSEITSSNVLVGVDLPDIYLDIYSKSGPANEKVQVQSLEIILQQLSGLPLVKRQKVMSLVVSPERNSVTRDEFYAFLALIACGQKNMDISLETVFAHRTDLPIPTFANIEDFNIRDITREQLNQKGNLIIQTQHQEQGQKDENYPVEESIIVADSTSSSNTVVNQSQGGSPESLNLLRNRADQEAMNDWIKNADHITVIRTPQKEGFLFRHVNYEIESERLGSKVLRRFSDFFWLWEVLLKRYPFRILPNLPPKKLGGRDDMFEERRRKGLVRFINATVRHPVLGKDDVVIAFLSHPSEINSWRRTNSPALDEEFVRKYHNISYLERHLPMDLDDRIIRMKKRISMSIQQYEHMCHIMNQMNRLKKALGIDYIRYSATLNSVSELDKQCWVPDCVGCSQVVDGYGCIAKSMHQAGLILNKQAIATGDSIVENLKRQRDLLESFKELLERKEKMSPVNKDTLARQVAKYRQGKVLPSVAHDDRQIPPTARDASDIWDENTGLTITQQREIFIKHCILDELSFLHKQQANVSTMYNSFVRDQIKYSRQWSEHWKQLEPVTSEMPNSPHDFL